LQIFLYLLEAVSRDKGKDKDESKRHAVLIEAVPRFGFLVKI
jgi:hypothetical protein